MKLGTVVAGAAFASAIATAAFADDTASSTTITFSEKGKTVCEMQIVEPSKGILAGKASKGCGDSVAGFISGSGSSEALVLATGTGTTEIQFLVEVGKKEFIGVVFDGKKAGTVSGTVAIK